MSWHLPLCVSEGVCVRACPRVFCAQFQLINISNDSIIVLLRQRLESRSSIFGLLQKLERRRWGRYRLFGVGEKSSEPRVCSFFCSDPKPHLLLFYSHIIAEELTCLPVVGFMGWQGTVLKSISQHNTHLNPTQYKQRATVTEVITATRSRAEENPSGGGGLPCNEKAASSTAVSNGHSNLKIQTRWSRPQSIKWA